MTISKSDLDAWIEREADRWVFETNGHRWSNNNDECGDNFCSFRQGAQTLAPLLLQAVEALNEMRGFVITNWETRTSRAPAYDCLKLIEAAVKGENEEK